VFVTYRGEGEFVGVIPRRGQHALKTLEPEIAFAIEESEGKHAGKLPGEAKLVLGPAVPVRLPTRGELSKAIWSAVEKVRVKADPLLLHESKSRTGRERAHPFSRLLRDKEEHEDSLRDEFKEMLRDQLNSEIGEHTKAVKAQPKQKSGAFMKREGGALKKGMKNSTKLFPKIAPQEKTKTALPASGTGEPGDKGAQGTEVVPMAGEGPGSLRYSNA